MRKLKKLCCYFLALALFSCGDDGAEFNPSSSGTGTAGSFASFVIVGDYLYAINGASIKTFQLDDNGDMTFRNQLDLSATLETLFPYENLLLAGSQQGVFFMDRTVPSNPELISVYSHITACDPVVAKDGIAFSTLRSTGCRFGGEDVLDAIDFSDIENPRIIRSYTSSEPLGLGIRGDFLFVCEKRGLTMYNAADPANLTEMDFLTFDGAIPLDVIPADQYLIVTTNRGVYNVLFTDVGEMSVLGQVTSN